jgi:hypothetical protein
MTYHTAIGDQISSIGANLTLCSEPKELYVLIKDDVVDQIIEHGLSKAESKLFFYFLKLDRFGDRPAKVKVASILLATGVAKTAYYKAIAKFETMGWFDFKHSDVEISNFCTPAKKSAKTNSDSAKTNSNSAKTNSDSAKTNSDSAKTNSNSAKTESKKLKALPVKDFKTPQTLQTHLDFNQNNQTLSEARRERNLILWKKLDEPTRRELSYFAYQVAIPKLPKRPTLPDTWISCHTEELFNQMMSDVEFQKKWGEFSANSPAVEIQEDISETEPRDIVNW